MAPFPETEIMTLKRIEVALRKMDLKLLKDGAYKLHEKFHSGFKFEYLDVLKEIREEVISNNDITQDIKGILVPTIDDILEMSEIGSQNSENKVSSLTSLSYNTNNSLNSQYSTPSQAPKIDAFSAFSSSEPKSGQNLSNQPQYAQSPIKVEPFREFASSEQLREDIEDSKDIQKSEELQTENNQILENFNNSYQEFEAQAIQQPLIQPQVEQNLNDNLNQFNNNQIEVQSFEPVVEQNVQTLQTQEIKTENELKSVAIFYHLNNSSEKIKNILKYRELINSQNTDLNELLGLLNEINTQSNVNVSELKTILEQLILKDNRINLITNSSSSDIVRLLKETDIDFDIFNSESDKKLNILPFLGLTNLFICRQCKQEYLDERNNLNSIIMRCPKCKGAMFPNLYAIKKDAASEIDMNYYNSCLIALAKSKVWLIIHPQLEDKTEINMLKTALMLDSKTESIFIVDKDINVRENCKKMFLELKEDLKINTQISVIEDFFNLMR